MRHSQVLVIAIASFLFASDSVAVATSNQVKNSKMAQSSPNLRLLRSHKYLVNEEEDESEDSVDVKKRDFATDDEEDMEERSPLSDAIVKKLDDIAGRWGTTYSRVALGHSSVSEAKKDALIAMRDAYISGDKKAKQAARMAVLNANNR